MKTAYEIKSKMRDMMELYDTLPCENPLRPTLLEQIKLLGWVLDKKIQINTEINENLAA